MSADVRRTNLVGGAWQAAASGEWLEVRDPADVRRLVAEVPAMGARDVAELYDRGEHGARTWRATPALERGAILAEAARLLAERLDEIAHDLVREMGKTLAEARGEVKKAAEFFEFFAAVARLPYGELLHDARADTETSVRREPLGVVLAITPWNDPLLTPARKLAPALVAGNAVILKPATNTPLVALHLAAALADAGLPAGVLGTATGRGPAISDALLGDPRLAAVSFTGGNDVGAQLRRALAESGVRLQTELGGKNASVVLADADLELAAGTIAAAGFGQAGQRCTATSRVIADRAVAAELVERLTGFAAAQRLGSGLDPETTMGPTVSPEHQQDVLTHLATAAREGAAAAAGGGRPGEERLAHGCFVEPSVLTGVEPGMQIWREEVFGPVLAVREVDGFDEAVAATNDSRYGLSSAVFTRSLEAAYRFADLADTGQVAVNLPTSGWDVHMPFGGFRESGSAFKEQGVDALRFYTRTKTVAIHY
ncbi:MAG TPA: aldehyde dehydrogenase family protein [Gaiellaceae bacterium]|nr:aldehyde dehydrogenase family protein [Gaiellaceae bacterium]